ncbi:MAG: hypothetical protein WAZ99_06380 [Rectinemataceae bacterium]
MKHGYLVDSPAPPHNAVRRRSRSPLTPRRQAGADSRAAAQVHPSGNKKLIVVESEGAVFDGLRHRHEQGYLPAFIGRFAWGADPSLCARIWRSVALESRFRGEAPQVCLAAALRLLNTRYPSVRRVAVAKALETHLAARAPGTPGLDRAVSGAAADLVADWQSMAEGLLREAGPPPVFEEASRFLARTAAECPDTDVLVLSRYPEATALNLWEMAGLGDRFLRIAGCERGDMAEYLRSALEAGYDTVPLLVIGSCRSTWIASQSASARFYPIVPGKEAESWLRLSESPFATQPYGDFSAPRGDFPAFLEAACGDPFSAGRG